MTEPFSVLVSYWYFRHDTAIRQVTDALRAARDRDQPIRLMVDSGAFSAYTQGSVITTADYARWLLDVVYPLWGEWLVAAVNLDVLGEPDRSWANWVDLRERGCDTLPVTHMGDDFTVGDRYVSEGGVEYLAVGSLVDRPFAKRMRWCAHFHRHVAHHYPHVRLHGLGVSAQQMVERLPWWSVDASSFGASYRYGRLKVYDPHARKVLTIVLPGARLKNVPSTTALYRHGKMLRDVYGLSPDLLHASGPENRPLFVMVAARAMHRWQADLRCRRPVSPPAGLGGNGTHLHWVDGAPEITVQALSSVGTHLHHVDANTGYMARAIANIGQEQP